VDSSAAALQQQSGRCSVAEFRLDQSQIRALLSGPSGPVVQDLRRRGNAVVREAKRICPKDTATLSRSITMEMAAQGGVPVVYVGSSLEYAIYVHEGTGIYSQRNPRPIVPVRKKALRWAKIDNSGSGFRRYRRGKTAQWVFSKSSKGTPGRPFLKDALPAAYR
jgi:hypothetical protein